MLKLFNAPTWSLFLKVISDIPRYGCDMRVRNYTRSYPKRRTSPVQHAMGAQSVVEGSNDLRHQESSQEPTLTGKMCHDSSVVVV